MVDGVCDVISGNHARLTRGPDADLWQAMIRAAPVTPPTWVPAHKSIDHYRVRGLPDRVWHGNQMVDHLAKAWATSLSPDRSVVESRNATLTALRKAQDVIATVQGLALDAKHDRPHGWAPKVKRKRRIRQALHRRLHRPRAKAHQRQ